jgi:hypothetical protein
VLLDEVPSEDQYGGPLLRLVWMVRLPANLQLDWSTRLQALADAEG